MKLSRDARFSTICIHGGQEPDPGTGAIITPIFQTSTYVQDELGRHKGFEYARTQNPTRSAVEANLAAIEGGTAGFAFASGMAAINAIATLLRAGDHVVVTDNTYGGTYRLFEQILTRYGLTFSWVDTSRPDEIAGAMRPETKMVFIETPTNPVLRLTDIAKAAEIARAGGARLVVDNTFASPALQRPIALGADIVVHSTTKYLNGHSDGVGGIVVLARDEDVEYLRFVQNAAGAILSPFDSWPPMPRICRRRPGSSSGRNSATMATIFEVPISRPTMRFLFSLLFVMNSFLGSRRLGFWPGAVQLLQVGAGQTHGKTVGITQVHVIDAAAQPPHAALIERHEALQAFLHLVAAEFDHHPALQPQLPGPARG